MVKRAWQSQIERLTVVHPLWSSCNHGNAKPSEKEEREASAETEVERSCAALLPLEISSEWPARQASSAIVGHCDDGVLCSPYILRELPMQLRKGHLATAGDKNLT
ncbi:hypothetical protein GOODEAATRI_009261 [Goodea atripinnis]|uniref:Uncharacterized protein n=1 Tax=Goodea atripinnis TaxID=208336 RepID=A0ABV0NIP7_9TELE